MHSEQVNREQAFLRFIVRAFQCSIGPSHLQRKEAVGAVDIADAAFSSQLRDQFQQLLTEGLPEWLFRWTKGRKRSVVVTIDGVQKIAHCDVLSPELWTGQSLQFGDQGLLYSLLSFNSSGRDSGDDRRRLERWQSQLLLYRHSGQTSFEVTGAPQRALSAPVGNGDVLLTFMLQCAERAQSTLMPMLFPNPLRRLQQPMLRRGPVENWSSSRKPGTFQKHKVHPWKRAFEPDLLFLLPWIMKPESWTAWLQELLRTRSIAMGEWEISELINVSEAAHRVDILSVFVAALCQCFTPHSIQVLQADISTHLTEHHRSMEQVQKHRQHYAKTIAALLRLLQPILQLYQVPAFERRPDQQLLLHCCAEEGLTEALNRARSLRQSLQGVVGEC